MPLLLLQGFGFVSGFVASIYTGYALFVDPVLVARYKHMALLEEIHRQFLVEESRMSAELSELDAMRRRMLPPLRPAMSK